MLKLSVLAHILSAMHLSSYVDSPFESRGGLMIVAPVAGLKTSLIKLLDEYPGVCGMSDLNTRSLKAVRDDIVAGKVRTLTIYDFQKIYERKGETASNIEGTLRSMTDEGFSSFSDEPQRAIQSVARVTLISAMPPKFYREHIEHWTETGLSRRMLWCVYKITNIEKLIEAVESWKRAELQSGLRFGVPFEPKAIPMSSTTAERSEIRRMVRFQPDQIMSLQIMIKIHSVLRWRCRKLKCEDESFDILRQFAESLQKQGGEVRI